MKRQATGRGKDVRELGKILLSEGVEKWLEECARLNPEWIVTQGMMHVYESLAGLWHYMQDETDPDVNWENPFALLQYDVEMDWEKWPEPRIIRYRTDLADVTEGNLAKKFSESVTRSQRIEALWTLTRKIIAVRPGRPEREDDFLSEEDLAQFPRMDLSEEELEQLEEEVRRAEENSEEDEGPSGWYLLPQDIQEKIAVLPEEEQRDAIEALAYHNINIPIPVGENEEDPHSEEILVTISVSPLIVYPEAREAYFQTFVAVAIPESIAKGCSVEQQREFMETLLEVFEKGIPEEALPKRFPIEIGYEDHSETFAIPSHPAMFTLIALFAGRPERIPRKALGKGLKERTPEEQREVDEFVNSILEPKRPRYYEDGDPIEDEARTAVLSDSPALRAKGEIAPNLFEGDLMFQEGELARYIRTTFGPKGMRHLLGYLIALDENFRSGYFEWNVNEHLTRLGIRRNRANRTHREGERLTALRILQILTSIQITNVSRVDEGRESPKTEFRGQRLFLPEGFTVKSVKDWVIDETIRISATSFWYRDAFLDNGKNGRQYTKLLKSVAKENDREHATTIFLTPLLAIQWRMNPTRKLSVRSLLEWCNLPTSPKRLRESLKDLEAELEYMKERRYLGEWTSGSEMPLSELTKQELDATLVLSPPDWLNTELRKIRANREARAIAAGKAARMTREEFASIADRSGLTLRQFGGTLGLAPSTISRIRSGERTLTPEVETLVREKFGYLLEGPRADSD